jgi:hypothetical protein
VQQQEKPVRRTLLSAAGAFALAAVAFSTGAQAQCAWTGYGWNCGAPPAYAQPYYSGNSASPYAAWNAYDYRDYRYQPNWLPTYPGPRPGR